jgi:hypothetical protein
MKEGYPFPGDHTETVTVSKSFTDQSLELIRMTLATYRSSKEEAIRKGDTAGAEKAAASEKELLRLEQYFGSLFPNSRQVPPEADDQKPTPDEILTPGPHSEPALQNADSVGDGKSLPVHKKSGTVKKPARRKQPRSH